MQTQFRKYEKVQRLGKEETDGLLNGFCHIEEKIDGANLQVFLDESGTIQVGSRNQIVTDKGFNGAVDYVRNHEGIKKLLNDHPEYRLYGEWLVKHTIDYNPTAYKKFYLFDIHNDVEFIESADVHIIAIRYGIEHVPYLGAIENPTIERLKSLMGSSKFGDRGEGIVIKNHVFRNAFGDFVYAKIVEEKFKEDNGVVFGGNNKFSDTYWEMYVVNKYIDVARVEKIMHKLQPMIDKRLDMEHIPRICGTVYHDMITEEAWEIANKVEVLNFKALQRIAFKKAKQVYVDILNNSISVADIKS